MDRWWMGVGWEVWREQIYRGRSRRQGKEGRWRENDALVNGSVWRAGGGMDGLSGGVQLQLLTRPRGALRGAAGWTG
jgi:hypothetical protein